MNMKSPPSEIARQNILQHLLEVLNAKTKQLQPCTDEEFDDWLMCVVGKVGNLDPDVWAKTVHTKKELYRQEQRDKLKVSIAISVANAPTNGELMTFDSEAEDAIRKCPDCEPGQAVAPPGEPTGEPQKEHVPDPFTKGSILKRK